MTVCIAAIHGKTKGVVAVADKMFTSAPGILTVHEVNENNKIAKLTKKVIAMMAGNVTNASSIISELISKISENESVESIAAKAAAIYQEHYRKAVESEALSRWGLTLEDFVTKQQTLDHELVSNLNKTIASSSLEVEMIIAGLDENGPHLYIINNPGTSNCLDSIGVAYAGSGSAHASLSLVDSQYQKSDNLGQVLFKTYKAKKRAEYDPNVGKYTSVCLVNEEVKELTDEDIKQIYDVYEESDKSTLKIIDDATITLKDKFDGNSRTKK